MGFIYSFNRYSPVLGFIRGEFNPHINIPFVFREDNYVLMVFALTFHGDAPVAALALMPKCWSAVEMVKLITTFRTLDNLVEPSI